MAKSRTAPPLWVEYGTVIAVIIGFSALIFGGIGLLIDNLVWLIPPAIDQQLGQTIVPEFAGLAEPSPAQTKLNQILDRLETHLLGDTGLGGLAGGAIEAVTDATYSQAEELQADAFGLQLLVKHYGHGGGAVDIFKRIEHLGDAPIPFLASHPQTRERINRLEDLIQSRGYAIANTTPLAPVLRSTPLPPPSPPVLESN